MSQLKLNLMDIPWENIYVQAFGSFAHMMSFVLHLKINPP